MKTYLQAISDFASDVKQAKDDINEAQPVADMIGLPVNEILKETKPMAITNASSFAERLLGRARAAQERIAAAEAKADGGFAKMDRAAGEAEKFAEQIEREAGELESKLGQFSNFGPD